jgi:hypothetical protein
MKIPLTCLRNTVYLKMHPFCSPRFSLGVYHRVHTEWQLPISGVHSIMIEKSALAEPFKEPRNRFCLLCNLAGWYDK